MIHQGFQKTVIVLSIIAALFTVLAIASLSRQEQSTLLITKSSRSSSSARPDSLVQVPNSSGGHVSLDQLKQKLQINFYSAAPTGFDPTFALEQAQPLVYPFPGYQYVSLTVGMRDSPRDSYNELKLPAVAEARQRGEFIFGLFIEGHITSSSTPLKNTFIDYYDSYYFLFSYSPKDRRYQLLNTALSLQGVPLELRARAISIASKLTHDDISIVGWVRKDTTSSIPGAEGLPEGTIYIQTQPSELSMTPYLAYYFVDVSNGKVVKIKFFE